MAKKHPVSELSQVQDPELVRQRQWRLVEVTAELAERKGFDRVALPEIARAANMSVGSVYRYITCKEDLLGLILEHVVTRYQDIPVPDADALADPLQALENVVTSLYSIIDEEANMFLVMYRDIKAMPRDTRARLKEIELRTTRLLKSIIDAGIERGVFRALDSEFLAYNLLVLGHMWVLKQWRFRSRMTVKTYARLQVEVVTCALRCEPCDDELLSRRPPV